jgi:hypothetical protein
MHRFTNHPGRVRRPRKRNDDLLTEWPFLDGVLVYHLHESPHRLARLAKNYW